MDQGMETLNSAALAFCVGTVNSEYRCLLMGAIQTGELQTQDDIHARIMTACGGDIIDKLSPYRIGNTLRLLPRLFIHTETMDGGPHYQYAKRSETERFITSLAGHHLRFADTTSLALRNFLGETVRNPRDPAGPTSTEIRLGVLACANLHARRSWRSGPDILDHCEELGYNRLTAEGHLLGLIRHGLMERRGGGRGGRHHAAEYRLRQHNGYVNVAEVVSGYLVALGQMIVADHDTIVAGLDHMDRYLSGHDTSKVAYLLRRSWASTGRSGPRNLSNKKQAVA